MAMTADEWVDAGGRAGVDPAALSERDVRRLIEDAAADRISSLERENTELRAQLARHDPAFELREYARRTVTLTPAQVVAVDAADG